MATKVKSEFPPQPTTEESDEEYQEPAEDDQDEGIGEPKDNVSRILQQLQSSGALIKKPKQEFKCRTCDEEFCDWADFESHLLQHVSLPSIILEKLPSDDELDPSDEEPWTDEEEAAPPPQAPKTPQKMDLAQILSNPNLQIKKPSPTSPSDSALNKLSGLGFTIKKNLTPIKEEKQESATPKSKIDLMKKLEGLGGLKMKLKCDGAGLSSFKVVNGLRDFQTSDDEGGDDDKFSDEDKAMDHSDDSADEEAPLSHQKAADTVKLNVQNTKPQNNIPQPKLIPKTESPIVTKQKPTVTGQKPIVTSQQTIVTGQKPIVTSQQTVVTGHKPIILKRPSMKQTPKRTPTPVTIGAKITEITEIANPPTKPSPISQPDSTTLTPKRQSLESNTDPENIVVKKEIDDIVPSQTVPLFSNEIKIETSSPPPSENVPQIPVISRVKSEIDIQPPDSAQPVTNTKSTLAAALTKTAPLLPVTKTEDTIIEINGDSNDEDDDCCVVSATPAPDIKPIIPKTENTTSFSVSDPYQTTTPSYMSSTPSYATTNNGLSSQMPPPSSTIKQHSFNWNAPDTKPPIAMLEKSADDIFDSIMSSTKKEGLSSMSDSEYISLDRLGSQNTCDVCNTRFTDVALLEDHIRRTGHSKSIITPTSSTLMPYNPSSNILSSLLPVKHLADQVGKLSTLGGSSSSGFGHQQNVMINIQTYPGASGMMPPQQGYGNYGPGMGMHGQGMQYQHQHQQPGANMYNNTGTVPGQYPGQYVGQPNYNQQYPGQMPSGQMPYQADQSNMYQPQTPLQSMQQSVYGQSGPSMSTAQPGMQMGPPQYIPAPSSGGSMRPPMGPPPAPSGVKIQNVQTFAPGQMIGANGQPLGPVQVSPGASHGGTLRMAAPPRPRMATVRGVRPTIRPGLQVQGQAKGKGVRMPMKRPANAPAAGPALKKRPDMLLPGKHDNEDCHIMSLQKQRDGLPMIHSVQGAKDKLNLGSQISITKKTVNKEANAMANVLASRGISIKQKQKSRSPSPERPIPHIPNLGAGVSIKHTSKSSTFSIPEVGSGGGGYSCRICKKMFMSSSSLTAHMVNAHQTGTSKINIFKCDECPASYPKSLQLQHHRRVFHNATGENRELGLPVVDMSQESTLSRLRNLGIYSYIPLANREQPDGCFGIPIISVSNAQNGMTNSLRALGADGLLSLGPLKSIPND